MKCVIIKSKQELCGSPDGAEAEPEGLAALLAGFRMQECVSKHSGYSALLPVLCHEQKTDFGETLGWLQRFELRRALMRHSECFTASPGSQHHIQLPSTERSVIHESILQHPQGCGLPELFLNPHDIFAS